MREVILKTNESITLILSGTGKKAVITNTGDGMHADISDSLELPPLWPVGLSIAEMHLWDKIPRSKQEAWHAYARAVFYGTQEPVGGSHGTRKTGIRLIRPGALSFSAWLEDTPIDRLKQRSEVLELRLASAKARQAAKDVP